MRVALVVPGGVDSGGRERVIPALLWLIEALAARHDVRVLVLFQSEKRREYDLLGARVLDLGLRRAHAPGLGLLAAMRAVRRAVLAEPPEVVHAFWGGTPGWAAGRAARAAGVPMLLSLGGGELVSLPRIGYGAQGAWRTRIAVSRSLRLADGVTAASSPMLSLARAFGVAAEQVPLGVKRALFESIPRAEDGPPYRLLHVADLNPVKDQATLLPAFARIARELPDARLDVVGRDTMDGAAARHARALGLAERVTFHGFLPSDELPPLLARAHLLLHSSLHEAGPVAVLEAAAAGVPCVGTAVGHVVDLAPAAAVAVPVGDAAALASEAVALLHDPARRHLLGENARAWAFAHDACAAAARFSELYARLAGRSRSTT